MSRHLHLVGSVPLSDAREVFTVVSRELGPYLKRIPDGETGERLDWITWLEPIFVNHPAFEPSGETFQLHGALQRRDRRYRLKPGVAPDSVKFDNILYGDVALRSYEIFAELKQQGIIPAHCKFQIDFVPAHSVIWLYVQEELQRAIDTPFNEAVLREIDKIAAAIPHGQIAIQFDVASAVFARLERAQQSPYGQGETELCLGLIHYTDGVDGTMRRLDVAKQRRACFSLATECGFGRRDPSTLPELLRIHADVAAKS